MHSIDIKRVKIINIGKDKGASMNKNLPLIALLAIIVLGVLALVGCRKNAITVQDAESSATRQQDKKDYDELKTYQGVKLSSINDFRENSIKGPQKVDIDKYILRVFGEVDTPRTYTYQQVLSDFSSHRKVLTMDCVEGWDVTLLWEGPLISDIINSSGVTSQSKIVIFHSTDGYTTSFPLSYIMENPIVLAYKMNGVVLPPERGFPFQLAAEGKWGYKWAKWVSGIELSADTSYRGYWESRGYSNSGDLDKPMFERN
jgi:DMSO/TMAO reductase YedYZ molybdopterin-dependent catalytic subunit